MLTTEPTASASRYQYQLPTTANTKIPPCGAIRVHLNTTESAPATAEPTMHEGMTASG